MSTPGDGNVEICKEGGKGILLATGEMAHWPRQVRGVLYGMCLVYCFLGVSIVSDTFMGAIEAVTSRRRQVRLKSNRTLTVRVWNDTVANLTLMALGSSAPEIMLSVVELLGRRMYSGELGPSTIVGSAAFNLLVIVAVCIVVIPTQEVRKIKELTVFYITMVFSLFAYLWLVVILTLNTPHVVDVHEAVFTLLFLPLLVWVSYLGDKGWFGRMWRKWRNKVSAQTAPASSNGQTSTEKGEEFDEYVAQVCEALGYVGEANMSEVKNIIGASPATRNRDVNSKTDMRELQLLINENRSRPKSRATYRIEATRNFTGGKRLDPKLQVGGPRISLGEEDFNHPGSDMAVNGNGNGSGLFSMVQILSPRQCFSRDVALKPVIIHRTGDCSSEINVSWSCHVLNDAETTASASRSSPSDAAVFNDICCADLYSEVHGKEAYKGQCIMKAGEDQAKLMVRRPVPPAGCTEDFAVVLNGVVATNGAEAPLIGPTRRAVFNVVPGSKPGSISFNHEAQNIQGTRSNQNVKILVRRTNGCSGAVSCRFRTEKLTAVPNFDFMHVDGTLEFDVGVTEQFVELTILPKGRNEVTDHFLLILDEAGGGAEFNASDDGGPDSAIMTITIDALEQDGLGIGGRLIRALDSAVNLDQVRQGTYDWVEQFACAIYCNGDRESQKEASASDWFFHVISLPWKLVFTLVPPPSYGGGWVCFVSSLIFISGVTAVIGDLAALFGCVWEVADSVTAITFVALGTSMPDLFASQSAAAQDPWADASICNVTGSNSVNVFLGLGLPWTMAAIYWNSTTRFREWQDRYPDIIKELDIDENSMVFIVPAGALSFNVLVFCVAAVIALSLLNLRRKAFGAELGGPPVPKAFTAITFVMLWLSYIALASWQALRGKHADRLERFVVCGILAVVVVVVSLLCITVTMWFNGWREGDGIDDTDGPCPKDRPAVSLEELLGQTGQGVSTIIEDEPLQNGESDHKAVSAESFVELHQNGVHEPSDADLRPATLPDSPVAATDGDGGGASPAQVSATDGEAPKAPEAPGGAQSDRGAVCSTPAAAAAGEPPLASLGAASPSAASRPASFLNVPNSTREASTLRQHNDGSPRREPLSPIKLPIVGPSSTEALSPEPRAIVADVNGRGAITTDAAAAATLGKAGVAQSPKHFAERRRMSPGALTSPKADVNASKKLAL